MRTPHRRPDILAADRTRRGAAQLVRAGRLVRAHRRWRSRRKAHSRGRPRDSRSQQPRGVQQSGAPAPAPGRRDPRAGRAALFRHQRLGRRTARRARAAAARAVRVRRAAASSSRGRRGCERARDQNRATGARSASRPGRDARPFVSRRQLSRDGALRATAARRFTSSRTRSASDMCRRPMRTGVPSAARTDEECGARAAAAVADCIDRRKAGTRSSR